jgi:hypothetical protein
VDFNWMGIRTLQMLGLAWDVKRARIRQEVAEDGDDQAGVTEAVA